MELGIAFAKLGAKVTIIEALPKILPLYDSELTQPIARRLADLGVETLLGARALGFTDGALKVEAAGGKQQSIAAGKVLVAVGRRAHTSGFGLETLDLAMTGPFYVSTRLRDVDAQRLGDRRRDRRTDARPPRDGARRNGRRDHRREEARL